ncbi:MAG: phosphate ABC transporter substrate-binding protein PstS [Myxococcales bacterium]|nr:phosphate ABC transporter substrate-binding protein PstS [Myxococcales bacterium]
MITRRILVQALVCLPLAASIGCAKPDSAGPSGAGSAASPPAGGTVTLNGAGATFPYPLYSKWISEYNKANPNVQVNYQSIGSGGGIRQISAGTVDFGASDAPMTADETQKAPGKLHHIPTTLGAVVITYNVPGLSAPLKLSADAVSGVYLGTIKKWNDPKIAEGNPGASLPDKDIAVVYRSDGSGTTAVFTDYLAKVSSDYKDKVGAGKSVKWPVGLGAKGNEGVTGQVKTTPYTIGYVELAYARQNKLPIAQVKNKGGQFVEPTAESITAAAAGVDVGDTLTASLTDPAGEKAYPIASFTYLLVFEDAKDRTRGQALAKFLWWALHDGQKHAAELDYAPLPDAVIKKTEERLRTLRSGNDKLLPAG